MTFSYNADVVFGQSTAEVIDHAKSLLRSLVDERETPEILELMKDGLKKIFKLC
jgi:hypothetical protein